MAAASLPRPGVQVIQQFRAVTPTIITPTLVPHILGVCKQIVDLLVTTSSGGQTLNPDALIDLPALILPQAPTGTPAVYTGLDGMELVLSINNAPDVTVAFSDPSASGLSSSDVVEQINTSFTQQGVTAASAVLLSATQWEIATLAKGEFQSILVDTGTSPEIAAAFGLGIGYTYTGTEYYDQFTTVIPEVAYPDPRSNLSELAIEPDTVRAFLATGNGTNIVEASQTQSFLQNGNVSTAASVVSTTDLTTITPLSSLNGTTLVVNVDGGVDQTITFAGVAAISDILTQINAGITGQTATESVVGNYLVLTDNNTGSTGTLIVRATSTVLSIITFAPLSNTGVSIAAVDDGNGDAFTPLLEFAGYNFTAAATHATITASSAPTLPLPADSTLEISDGNQPQTIVFTGLETSVAGPAPSLKSAIEAVLGTAAGGNLAVTATGGALTLTNTANNGAESIIAIIGGTALAEIDPGVTPALVAGTEVTGNPYQPAPGDELWIDGVLYAHVYKVAPGGNTARIRIDQQVPISPNVGTYFFIEAKNLTAPAPVNRPSPDLQIDLSNNLTIKANILRDYTGAPISVKTAIYVSYRAVREDTTAIATNPGLLTFEDTTTLDTSIGPTTPDNPLALGLFFALINAPGVQVTGLGIDAISATEPFGTVEAYTRAAEFLEGYEVYAIVPLTHDESVGQILNTHVQFMSEPQNRGERIVLWNPQMPTRALDALAASGTNGDALGTAIFDTKIANLSVLLQNEGISTTGSIPASANLFLELAVSNNLYSIKSVVGSQITVRTTAAEFPNGTNNDDFYAETVLPTPLIGEVFTLRIRGAALVTSIGTPDKDAIADTVNAMGASFGQRRFWMTVPDRCAATLNGTEQIIDGFYMAAATAGAIAQQPPQQSFTNFPITGFTRVLGSNDTFGEAQLDVMAGGGAYIFIQDSVSAPVYARMALTTDLTSIETRTDSVTKVVDFTAKFMRAAIKNFIGRFNITQGFLDSLGTTIQGLFGFLVESGVLIGGSLDNIIQDENNRDTVLVDTTLDVPIPCNYIKLTLVI